MSVAVSRQEVQTMIDQARNRIMERMVSKYEIQGAVDNARDRLYSYIYDLEHQQLRAAAVRHEQQWRKMISLENRMRSLEAELSALNQNLSQLLSKQNEIAGVTRRINITGNDSMAILQRALHQGI